MMKKWYALKVFYNRFSEIKATLSRDGIESYIPMKTRSYPQPDGEVVIRRVPLVAILMFLRCDDDYISSLNSILDEKAMVYHRPNTQIPASIPDEEMDMFIMLTSSMEDGFEQIPYDDNLVKNAEKYRVTGGEYAGVVGYYRRIKKNKRLVIPFEGLLILVATNYIPKCYLQEIV